MKSIYFLVLTYPFLAGNVDDFSPYPGFGTVRSDETTASTRNQKNKNNNKAGKQKIKGASNACKCKKMFNKREIKKLGLVPLTHFCYYSFYKNGHANRKFKFIFFFIFIVRQIPHAISPSNKPANCC